MKRQLYRSVVIPYLGTAGLDRMSLYVRECHGRHQFAVMACSMHLEFHRIIPAKSLEQLDNVLLTELYHPSERLGFDV